MTPKTVFLVFASEDELFRELFITQWARAGSPVTFLDMPGGRPCTEEWRTQVHARILEADGVIALISGYTPASVAERWQIRCAAAEGKPLRGLWVQAGHRMKPVEMGATRCEDWTWENAGDFIDGL